MITLNTSSLTPYVPSVLRSARRRWTQRARRRCDRRHVDYARRLLRDLTADNRLSFLEGAPRIVSALTTCSGVGVVMVGDTDPSDVKAVLKIPLTAQAEHSIVRHRQVIEKLGSQPGLSPFRALVPTPLIWGRYDRWTYHIESALIGTPADVLGRGSADMRILKESAVEAILQLHLTTGRQERIDDDAFRRMAGDDLVFLSLLAERWPNPRRLHDRLKQVDDALRRGLLGLTVPLSWIHGDFWAGNLLFLPETGAVSGIVDWDRGVPSDLPLHDIFHMVAYTRSQERRTKLGEEIVSYLLPAKFNADDRRLILRAVDRLELPPDPVFLHGAALLYWLRFAVTNLSRYPNRRSDGEWLRKNIFLILEQGLP
jgi:hypothetical protein